MGKSQETYGKKENEKKKQQKKKEKEERKEERKQNNNKGKSFEDMLAYVDEFGNITTTPPEQGRRVTIATEDIELGARKRDTEPVELIRKGIVTFFNDSKGYGFIKDQQSQESVFVHINALSGPIKENDKVTFEIEKGQKGPMAVRVAMA